MTVLFGSGQKRDAWSLRLTAPVKTLVATSLSDVISLIQEAESEARCGSYVALLLSYEAAPAFDSALKTRQLDSFPLAWAAVYPDAEALPSLEIRNYRVSGWKPGISRDEYRDSIVRIQDLIAAGDTYQVNYSFPLTANFSGDALSWYQDLCLAQGARYSAYLDLGRYQVLSISPELFFRRSGDCIVTRPMKGTAKRGRWEAEDLKWKTWLANSTKNRAENIMIVDLLRNDLGKVSELGSVEVTSFFELEKFQTLWQLTSTVEAKLRKDISLADLFTALFPCGSVTGAPKIRTMEIIRELEHSTRGPYTGAIGLLKPGGDCIFNVAIRTLVLDTVENTVRLSVGGGVTIDSTPEVEYEECLLKAEFLNRRPSSFNLFESIRLENGTYFLLDRHLTRLEASARYFDFVFPKDDIGQRLQSLAETHSTATWKVRLDLRQNGSIETVASEIHEFDVRSVALASRPVDQNDRLLFHKTTHRQFYDAELAQRPDCDDIIFWNERGEITESTIANVVVKLDGELVTPPIEAGLLPGTYRAQLLAESKIAEKNISVDDLSRASELFLINSVRKWMRVSICPNPVRVSRAGSDHS